MTYFQVPRDATIATIVGRLRDPAEYVRRTASCTDFGKNLSEIGCDVRHRFRRGGRVSAHEPRFGEWLEVARVLGLARRSPRCAG